MGIFDTLNKNIGALGMPGGLGLMTTGLGLLEGESPLKAVQAGVGTFGALQEEEERRRRLGAIAKLGEQYAGDPRLKAIIDADPEAGLSLIAQLEANKRAYRAPTLTQQRKNLAQALGYAPDSQEYRNILETGSSVGPSYGMKEAGDGFIYYTEGPNKGQRVFPDVTLPPANAVSTIGKLTQDYNAGNISEDVYNSAIAKATNVPETLLQQRVNLAKALEYDAGTPQYESILSTGKYEAPSAQSNIGKLVADLDNKIININEFDQGLAKLTNIPDTLVTQRKNLATELGFTAGTPEYVEVLTTGKYEGVQAQTELAKLKQDLDNNLITEQTYNDRVAKLATTPPPSANVKNYVADTDITIGGKTYTAGTVFAVNQNDGDALGAVLEAGGRLAPTRTESTVTNTTADAVVPTGNVQESPVSVIDINTAAGGDVAGVATDILNKSLGFAFGTSFDPERTDAKANLAALENAVLPGLVKSISTTGAVRSQQDAKRLIPAAGDTNPEMRAKIERLVPVLQAKLKEAVGAQTQEKLTPTQRTLAQQVVSTYPNLIATLQLTLEEYKKAGITAAGSSTFSAADAIVK